MRVYEVARAAGIDSTTARGILAEYGIPTRSHSSNVRHVLAEEISDPFEMIIAISDLVSLCMGRPIPMRRYGMHANLRTLTVATGIKERD